MSRDVVSRSERGRLDGVTIGALDRLTSALGATLVVEIRWQGAGLDRLVDAVHARLQDAAARRLAATGWIARAEVSFNHYGDRGSCDLLAYHPERGVLLVVEVKSRIGNVQDTLHRLDVKARLGGLLAEQLGWPRPHAIARALVLPDERTPRRVIRAHSAVFNGFGLRGRDASAWLKRPIAARAGLIWFEKPASADRRRTMPGERVRSAVGEGREPHETDK